MTALSTQDFTESGAEESYSEGVIDYLRPNFMGIRTADALYCFFGRGAFGGPVGVSIHSFATDVDPEQVKQRWQKFLDTSLA